MHGDSTFPPLPQNKFSGAGEHDWHAQNLADFYRQLEPASDLLVVWAKDMKAAGIPRQAFLSEMLLQVCCICVADPMTV